MGLIMREVPFGERASKRALYRIADPFFRMWFRVVAPHRGPLATMSGGSRRALLQKYWPNLEAAAWEELARASVARLGNWGPASRFWLGNEHEWDIVAESLDGRQILLGEAKLSAGASDVKRLARRPLPTFAEGRSVVRALFAATMQGRTSQSVVRFGPRDVFGG